MRQTMAAVARHAGAVASLVASGVRFRGMVRPSVKRVHRAELGCLHRTGSVDGGQRLPNRRVVCVHLRGVRLGEVLQHLCGVHCRRHVQAHGLKHAYVVIFYRGVAQKGNSILHLVADLQHAKGGVGHKGMKDGHHCHGHCLGVVDDVPLVLVQDRRAYSPVGVQHHRRARLEHLVQDGGLRERPHHAPVGCFCPEVAARPVKKIHLHALKPKQLLQLLPHHLEQRPDAHHREKPPRRHRQRLRLLNHVGVALRLDHVGHCHAQQVGQSSRGAPVIVCEIVARRNQHAQRPDHLALVHAHRHHQNAPVRVVTRRGPRLLLLL
mmetsp:Transcript_43115/g.82232  ORF Transcript_43115/g.82232 Transcript_43115/m.82232 type:complete len:322 (+) Transcript_43115:1926-2891(+)